MRKINIIVIITVIILVLTTACLFGCKEEKHTPVVDPIDDNYRVLYQIFVGSFSDSNGDGIGDLRGIINRLDYLNDGDITSGKSLGVQAIWLSPIFTSPTYHKYDTTDYYSIDPKFGTMDDLKELIDLCHKRNVKVILDLVLNHTSDKHVWFEKFISARVSEKVDDPFYNFYSVSTDNKWEWNKGVKYECNFGGGMPELDYDNPQVRSTMLDVAKFYLEMGVDGFRFDAVKYIYYGDTKKSADFWGWYMDELKKIDPEIYTVGECWAGDSEVVSYYNALNCFNFTASGVEGHISNAARKGKIGTFVNYVVDYLKKIKDESADAMYMPFIANHDMDRAAGYLSVSMGDAFMGANLYLLCSGSPTIYYGEEIGLKGSRGGANTDANRRLAMLWGDDDSVRNPEGTTYDSKLQVNGTVKEQLSKKDSLLNHYMKLIAIRNKYPIIARGDYKPLLFSESEVGGFDVLYNNDRIAIIHNTNAESVISVPVPDGFSKVLESIGFGKGSIKNGMLEIDAQTSVILG